MIITDRPVGIVSLGRRRGREMRYTTARWTECPAIRRQFCVFDIIRFLRSPGIVTFSCPIDVLLAVAMSETYLY